jgi:hypothetical protein
MTERTAAMTKGEREDLQRLVRHRERALKSAARERSAQLLADFENQMGQEYSFDQDEVWPQAAVAAKQEVDKAQERVAARCRELGIPRQFAPSLYFEWHNRGYGNAIKARRDELRRMAQTRIEAIERQAIVQIELNSVEAQTEIAKAGLTSAAAVAFLERLREHGRRVIASDLVDYGCADSEANQGDATLRRISWEPEYDAADDFSRSINACYAAMRERVKNRGPGWPGGAP